jgi:hypothetical protein
MTTSMRFTLLAAAALLTSACGDGAGPAITTYGLRLNGVSSQHGAAMLNLRNLPANASFTPAPGVVVHARRTLDGQAYSLLVAGDLTRVPLLTFSMPRSSSQLGNVVELANNDGTLVNSGIPLVEFVAQ